MTNRCRKTVGDPFVKKEVFEVEILLVSRFLRRFRTIQVAAYEKATSISFVTLLPLRFEIAF